VNIILIGYRAAGKTSVGRSLAARLGLPFYDTDEILVRDTGKTIRELVQQGGWSLFREKEKSAVFGLSTRDRCVIALGGGAVLDKDNLKRLGEKGLFVWLRADHGTIMNRMGEDSKNDQQRPSLSDGGAVEEVPAMLRSREEAYRTVAHFSVDTTARSIEEVSEEIMRILRSS
jgi:shikimate kinase